MQKLELRNNLNTITSALRSHEFLNYLSSAGATDLAPLLKLVIDSKAGFDQCSVDSNFQKIFEQFKTDEMYNTNNFSNLVSFISKHPNAQVSRSVLLGNNTFNNFYVFHKTLVSTLHLVDNLLIDNQDLFDAELEFDAKIAEDNGFLIFQVIDNDKIPIQKLNEIIKSLTELIETVYLLFDKIENEQFDVHPKVSMLDSGSDINIVINLPKKASNLLAQIVKEFWDLMVNRKSVRHAKDLKNIEKSITTLGKIHKAESKGIIDPTTAEVLKKGVIENTHTLITRNTVTKEVVLESRTITNRDMLIEKSQNFLLDMPEIQNTKPGLPGESGNDNQESSPDDTKKLNP